MVTEFGWPNPSDGQYIQNVISYAEDQGWGWSVFTWGAATWGPFCLVADAGPGSAYEPRPTGMPALAAFAGTPGFTSGGTAGTAPTAPTRRTLLRTRPAQPSALHTSVWTPTTPTH